MAYNLKEEKCPICGKTFIPAQLHVYKVHFLGSHDKTVCSWKCVMDGERAQEQKRQRRRRITGIKR